MSRFGSHAVSRLALGVALSVVFMAALAGAAEDVDLVAWPGGPTPPLVLKDLDGRPYDLAQARGKAVLINFWATWCPPCRDELPTLQQLRESLRGRPLDIVTVNVAEGESRVKRFAAELPLSLPVLLDRDAEAQHAWKVRGLPATFIVDAAGTIRYWYLGELDWAQPKVRHTIESVLPQTH